MNEKTLGEHIRDARVAKGPSLRELARQLTITPSYLSDIENDRRVPAEEVLRAIANLLQLDFDTLMAMAGRFSEKAERYMKRHPTAGTLFRRISDQNLPEEELKKLLKKVEGMEKKAGEADKGEGT